MLGLSNKESKFFLSSFVLHVVLFAAAGFIGFIPSCEDEKKEVHVFELVSSSYTPPLPPVPEKIVRPPVVTKVLPQKPEVKPKPKPQILNKTKPVTSVTPKPTPKKVPKPLPKPKPKPKKISFNQFQKKHNLNSPPPIQAQPKKQIPKVRINPNNFSLPKITISNPSNTSSTVDPTILNLYLGEVKAKLEATWKRLQSDSPVATGGEAFLSFSISPGGTLVSAYISRSSGNAALDRLVLKVSKSVGNLGRPPGGKLSSSLEIPFRIQ